MHMHSEPDFLTIVLPTVPDNDPFRVLDVSCEFGDNEAHLSWIWGCPNLSS